MDNFSLLDLVKEREPDATNNIDGKGAPNDNENVNIELVGDKGDNSNEDKSDIAGVTSLLDLVVPKDKSTDAGASNEEKINYKALYDLKVKAGEFIEVEDSDKLDWSKKETYDAIAKYHSSKDAPDSSSKEVSASATQNPERKKVIQDQKDFINELKSDKYTQKEGYSKLIKYDYVSVKGLSEDEFNALFNGLTDEQIVEKGELLKKTFTTNAETIIKSQEKAEKDEAKATREAQEKAKVDRAEDVAKYKLEVRKSAKELNVSEEYIDKCIDMFDNGDIHKLIEKFVASSNLSPVQLVMFIEEKMGETKPSKKTIKIEELQLN